MTRPTAIRENLTRDEARARAEVVHVETTRVHLELERDEHTFASRSEIRFTTHKPATLFVDLTAVEVHRAELDGTPLPADAARRTRLSLGEVAPGEHVLVVEATMAYQHEGKGLHRFIDPADNRVYLHSQFEPFDAHLVYACFDQPDLKTSFELSVDAPAGWVVVSNADATAQPEPDDAGRWVFAPTERISTYLTAVVAGHYTSVHEVYTRPDGSEVPLGLYVRRSLARYLDADELFEVTRQGLAFYEQAFAMPYPFRGGYDQLFVPEFSAGAMENPGCITYSEAYVFRSKVTDSLHERRAETVLHEMAHLWFGDLVTMRWWDDLWLNESFATFMSVLAQVEATRFTEAWVTFLDAEKAWAKHQDQLPSTHPIADAMPDVESVHQNFDGITYAKGASVLRQLVAWVGQDAFLAGCRDYFARHAWGNTELDDFLAALERTSGRDLDGWRDEWLRTTGINVLSPDVEVDDDGRYTRVSIVQDAPLPPWTDVPGVEAPDGVLRRHRVAVGVYRQDGNALVRDLRVELDLSGARTEVAELVGVDRGALLLLNDDDLTYAKIGLDERSTDTLTHQLHRLTEPLPRALAWSATWDLVRDGVLAARRYLDLIDANIAEERQIGVLQRLLARAVVAAERYTVPEQRQEMLARLARQARRSLEAAPAGSDHQLAWARHWASCARALPEELRLVGQLLDGVSEVPGLTIDTELRWHLVVALARAGTADEARIAAELARDDTDLGQRHAATARAARPDAEAKQAAWDRLLGERTLSHTMSRQLWAGFPQPEQATLLAPYVERYFAVLPEVWQERSLDWAIGFSAAMFPHHAASPALRDRVDALLSGDELARPLRRVLLEQRDSLARTLAAVACDRAADSSAAGSSAAGSSATG